MNYKNIIKKQTFIIALSVIVMGVILIGTSFALFSNMNNSDSQTVQSGTLIVSYEGTTITTVGGIDGSGNLLEVEPIDETTIDSQTPYTIKVTNTGTLSLKYNIILYTGETNTLPHSYYAFKYKNNGSYTQKATITSLPKVDPSKTNMNEIRYKLTSEPFILNAGDSATHELYVWLDADANYDDLDEEIVNMKITVEGEATDEVAPPEQTTAKTIQDLVQDADPTSTDEIGTTGLAYDGTEDNNLRYIGANPNNYVSFNNELWRIIGVMNNIETESGETKSLIKIRRADSLGDYSWDSSDAVINGGRGVNEWSQADLMQELNNDYLGNITVGTDGKWYNGSSNTKTANKPTQTISSFAQNMIESVVWNLGSPNNNNGAALAYNNTILNAIYAYTHERSNYLGKICSSGGSYCNDEVTRTPTWTGKIAIMYSSDYIYATNGGNTTNRQECLNTYQYSWYSYTDCVNNNWLFDSSKYQWTISPSVDASGAYRVFRIDTGGIYGSYAIYAYSIRPVVFLKSNVLITGGTGTQADPYILG